MTAADDETRLDDAPVRARRGLRDLDPAPFEEGRDANRSRRMIAPTSPATTGASAPR